MSDVPTYGGWVRPQMRGVAGLSMGVTIMLGVAVLGGMVALLIGSWRAAVLMVGVAILLTPFVAFRVPGQDRTPLELAVLRLRHRRHVGAGRAVLAQGPVGLVPDGTARLPGLLAQSQLYEIHDAYGAPFGLLRVPSTGHYSVVIECAATGQDMTDQVMVDYQVASWGRWLEMLGQENNDISGAQVCVEAAPDTGVRLRASIDSARADAAPPFTDEVMEGIKADYPVGQARITTRVTVTFRDRAPGSRERRSAEAMMARVGNVLPTLVGTLASTGAGHAPRPMRAQDIIDATRVSYDPVVAEDVERARAEGGTQLTWRDAGPVFADARQPGLYRHDRGLSLSWQMIDGPRSAIKSDQLTRLLSPSPDVALKRVTMLYRPQDLVTSARVVEQDVTNASFAINGSRRIDERERLRLAQARQTASEEASGAGLVRFGLVVTATVLRADDLPRAAETVKQLSASARIRMRPATYMQDVVFTAGLPLGLVLPEHLAVPIEIKERM